MAAASSVLESSVKFPEICGRRSPSRLQTSTFQGFASEKVEKIVLSIIFKQLPFLKSDFNLDERFFSEVYKDPIFEKIESLQKLLFKVNARNSDCTVSPGLIEEIGYLIDELKVTKDLGVLLKIVHLLADFNFYYSKFFMIDVLKEIQKISPVLSKYMLPSSLIFIPAGIDLLLSTISMSFGWNKVKVGSFNIEKLSEIMGPINCNPGSYGIIFYYPGIWHVVPVFIKNDGTNVLVLITDSIGELGGNFCLEEFEQLQKDQPNLKIYNYICARQRNDFSCSVFALLDLINLVEAEINQRDIFKWLDLFNSGIEGEEKVKKISTLPPEMLCSTQYLSRLKLLIRKGSESAKVGAVFSDYICELKSLQKIIKANTYIDQYGKKANKYIERKHYKLIELLLSQLFKKTFA